MLQVVWGILELFWHFWTKDSILIFVHNCFNYHYFSFIYHYFYFILFANIGVLILYTSTQCAFLSTIFNDLINQSDLMRNSQNLLDWCLILGVRDLQQGSPVVDRPVLTEEFKEVFSLTESRETKTFKCKLSWNFTFQIRNWTFLVWFSYFRDQPKSICSRWSWIDDHIISVQRQFP